MVDLADSLKGRSQDHPREQSLRGVYSIEQLSLCKTTAGWKLHGCIFV